MTTYLPMNFAAHQAVERKLDIRLTEKWMCSQKQIAKASILPTGGLRDLKFEDRVGSRFPTCLTSCTGER